MTRPKRVLMFLLDGFDPGYVQPARMPRLAALMKAGASTLDGRGVLPSLTNVNHISLLTGTYPARHGLSTNFYYDRATRTDVFMEQVSFVQEPLVFERFKAAGWSTALVTAKEKLTKLLRRGLDVCVDMKTHPEAHRAVAGAPARDLLPRDQPLGVPDGPRGRAPRSARTSSTWPRRTTPSTCWRPTSPPCSATSRRATRRSGGSSTSTTPPRRSSSSRRTTG